MNKDKADALKRRVYKGFVKSNHTITGSTLLSSTNDQEDKSKQKAPQINSSSSGEETKNFYLNLFKTSEKTVQQSSETTTAPSEKQSTATSSSASSSIVTLVDRWQEQELENVAVFEIPPENKGYKMLKEQMGWKETGLGPTESGMLYPVPTVLKLKKGGIGSKEQRELKPRVTHYPSAEFDSSGRVTKESQERIQQLEDERRTVKIGKKKKGVQNIIPRKNMISRIRAAEKRKEKQVQNLILGRDVIPRE